MYQQLQFFRCLSVIVALGVDDGDLVVTIVIKVLKLLILLVTTTTTTTTTSIRLAAARRPTGFKVPFKGADSKEKKYTKPLHNPLAPGAVVLFSPVDLFSEK